MYFDDIYVDDAFCLINVLNVEMEIAAREADHIQGLRCEIEHLDNHHKMLRISNDRVMSFYKNFITVSDVEFSYNPLDVLLELWEAMDALSERCWYKIEELGHGSREESGNLHHETL